MCHSTIHLMPFRLLHHFLVPMSPTRLLLKGIELRGGHPVENYIHGAERRQKQKPGRNCWLTHVEVMRNSLSRCGAINDDKDLKMIKM